MAARANIALADGESTPVTHTFVPDGDLAQNVFAYRNLNATVPAASEVVTIGVKDSSSAAVDIQTLGKKVSPRSVQLRLKYPKTFTDVSGNTQIDYVDEVIVDFKIHPRSSEQRAKNLRTMLGNLLTLAGAGTQMTYAVEKGEKIW